MVLKEVVLEQVGLVERMLLSEGLQEMVWGEMMS